MTLVLVFTKLHIQQQEIGFNNNKFMIKRWMTNW